MTRRCLYLNPSPTTLNGEAKKHKDRLILALKPGYTSIIRLLSSTNTFQTPLHSGGCRPFKRVQGNVCHNINTCVLIALSSWFLLRICLVCFTPVHRPRTLGQVDCDLEKKAENSCSTTVFIFNTIERLRLILDSLARGLPTADQAIFSLARWGWDVHSPLAWRDAGPTRALSRSLAGGKRTAENASIEVKAEDLVIVQSPIRCRTRPRPKGRQPGIGLNARRLCRRALPPRVVDNLKKTNVEQIQHRNIFGTFSGMFCVLRTR